MVVFLVLAALLPWAQACTMTCSEMQCPANSRTHFAGASSLDDCLCDPNFWRNGSCQACRPGYICNGNTSLPCPAGYWSNGTAVFDCDVGYACPAASIDGHGHTSATSGIQCSSGWFLGAGDTCSRCPAGTTSAPYGCYCGAASWWDGGKCVPCDAGWICGANSTSACPSGMLCDGTRITGCPANHTCAGGLDVGCAIGFGGRNCTACGDGLSKDHVGYDECVASGGLGVIIGVVAGVVVVAAVAFYCVPSALRATGIIRTSSYAKLSTIAIPIEHTKFV